MLAFKPPVAEFLAPLVCMDFAAYDRTDLICLAVEWAIWRHCRIAPPAVSSVQEYGPIMVLTSSEPRYILRVNLWRRDWADRYRLETITYGAPVHAAVLATLMDQAIAWHHWRWECRPPTWRDLDSASDPLPSTPAPA